MHRDHRLVPQCGFEDLRIGEIFNLPSRTVGDSNVAAFQTLSLDNPPIHYDAEYCRELGHPGPLAHGLQVLAFTAAGAGLFPHVIGEALVGFLEVNARFLKPLYPALEIIELTPQRSTGIVVMRASIHNQRSELVLDGTHRYLLRLAPPLQT